VTRDVAAVTPQARDDFWAGPTILVLVVAASTLFCCVINVYIRSDFLDFAGMTENQKNKISVKISPFRIVAGPIIREFCPHSKKKRRRFALLRGPIIRELYPHGKLFFSEFGKI
jgi:hypothetical protein